jgi:ADP-ribosylglycohydrolase
MAANGAVMRTAVVGALFYKDMNVVYSTAMNLAKTTHADPRCLVSCTIASALVAAVRVPIRSNAVVEALPIDNQR